MHALARERLHIPLRLQAHANRHMNISRALAKTGSAIFTIYINKSNVTFMNQLYNHGIIVT
jgi:hypothetical protein